MIVADANLMAYLQIEGKFTPQAKAIFEKDPFWLVPSVWPHEHANILVTHAKRLGFSEKRCLRILHESLEFVQERVLQLDLDDVISFAIKHDISAYDAEYLRLAELMGIPCVTEDKKLLRKFPALAASMARFLAS